MAGFTENGQSLVMSLPSSFAHGYSDPPETRRLHTSDLVGPSPTVGSTAHFTGFLVLQEALTIYCGMAGKVAGSRINFELGFVLCCRSSVT